MQCERDSMRVKSFLQIFSLLSRAIHGTVSAWGNDFRWKNIWKTLQGKIDGFWTKTDVPNFSAMYFMVNAMKMIVSENELKSK